MIDPLWRRLISAVPACLLGLAAGVADAAVDVLDDERRSPLQVDEASSATTVSATESADFVGHIVISGRLDHQSSVALFAAIDDCWRRGDLKLQVAYDVADVDHLIAEIESRGFGFSRLRERPGLAPTAEFYADLYLRRDGDRPQRPAGVA